MRLGAVKYAVLEFENLQTELKSLIGALGLKALTIMVRQKATQTGEPDVWVCKEIGLHDNAEVLWGIYYMERAGKPYRVKVVLDIETIRSIEFEIFDGDDGSDGDEHVDP